MIDGFKAFILRGNVLDLAVAVVIGAAFGAIVTSLVDNIITPLIGAIGGQPDFSGLTFTINNSVFHYGAFINSLIAFLIIALVIYFLIVAPMNRLMAKVAPTAAEATAAICPQCFGEISPEANRCRNCTTWLRGPNAPVPSRPSSRSSPKPASAWRRPAVCGATTATDDHDGIARQGVLPCRRHPGASPRGVFNSDSWSCRPRWGHENGSWAALRCRMDGPSVERSAPAQTRVARGAARCHRLSLPAGKHAQQTLRLLVPPAAAPFHFQSRLGCSKTLTVSAKQVTLAVFRQLMLTNLIVDAGEEHDARPSGRRAGGIVNVTGASVRRSANTCTSSGIAPVKVDKAAKPRIAPLHRRRFKHRMRLRMPCVHSASRVSSDAWVNW